MRSLKVLILTIIIVFWGISLIQDALAFGNNALVTINGKLFTKEDYRQWWLNWKEDSSVFPNDLNQFIEWHLLVEEAKKMEFESLPSYRKKLETFLRVRGIFLLKNDEIDSKIKITDDDINVYFIKKYNPIWKTLIYSFNNEEAAQNAFLEINKNGIKNYITEYFSEKIKITPSENQFSPISFKDNDILHSLLINMNEGSISSPIFYNDKYILVILLKVENHSNDFLNSHRDRIIKDIRKIKQAELTKELLERLKIKFMVNIDRNLFAIAENVTSNEDLNKIFITTSKGNILLNTFVKIIPKDKVLKIKQYSKGNEIESFKESILNNMLFDVLIAWEILDRHYEKNPKISNIYEFYKQNRLLVEFNKEILEKNILITDSDVENYYKTHLSEFSRQESVTLAIINVDVEVADKISNGIKQGVDFFDLVKKYYQADLPIQQLLINDLEPEIKAVVNKLSSGEVSESFLLNKRYFFVKLISKQPSSVIPIEQVTPGIADKLFQEKLKIVKNDFITKLKSKSKISINDDIWSELRKEFGDTDVRKDN